MATENYGLPEPTTTPKVPKTKAKGGTIKVEAMSLDQFRSYLKGIMFVGGPTWRPDREQWEAIVAIIDKLTVDTPQQPTQPQQVYSTPSAGNPAAGWDQTQPTWQPMSPAVVSSLNPPASDDGPYRSQFI